MLKRTISRAVRIGLALAAALTLGSCEHTRGWDSAGQKAWHNADQGSRLMPLKWFQALEQPEGGKSGPLPTVKLFMDNAYLAQFKILPPMGGAALPVGFAIDQSDDKNLVKTRLHWLSGSKAADDRVDWVGLNCAACHTAQMTYGQNTFTVDGAPSLFDFQSFVEALDQALVQTRDSAAATADGKRWDRFAHAVLGQGDDTAANRTLLLAQLNSLIDWETQTEALNHTDLRYGYGRVDAVGHIFNRILLFGGGAQPVPNPADAPVSYPHLWNITKETQVQWDGIATNAKINIGAIPTDFGAMGRNVGEVLGVFGEAVIRPRSGPTDFSGFASSVDIENLNDMEVLLTKLQPPPWPAPFGAPGAINVADASGHTLSSSQVLSAGGALFNDRCAACHTPHTTYETMETFAQLGPKNQTDEWMACNAWADTGASGALTNMPVNYVSGDATAASSPVRGLLATTVKGVLVGKKGDFAKAAAENIFGVTPLPRVVTIRGAQVRPQTPKEIRLQLCQKNAANPLMAYKARPLEGIWATAPYLHNGSVPTLYDLLLPPEQRPKTFAMGTRAFDPAKVGYVTSPSAPGNSFVYDTSLPGNSNKGHDYGMGTFTPAQRLELLEYLKSL
jgi:mono/diheme cytochrome c family protein